MGTAMRYRVIIQYYVEGNNPQHAILKAEKDYISRRLLDVVDEMGRSFKETSRAESNRMVNDYLRRGGKIKYSKKSKVGGMTVEDQDVLTKILQKQGVFK